MPLKVSSNATGVWITWENPDESMSATFRIKTKASDEEILKTLVKATTFIAKQMGAIDLEIAELELATQKTAPTTATPATSPTTVTAPSTPNGGPPPNAERISMTPPASLSDRPSDGGPVPSTFGWGSLPTTSVPSNRTTEQGGGWELIPPGEM